MKVSLDPHSRRLRFLCSLYQLSQLVDEPTRVTETSSTLIDLILTNRPENILSTGVIHLGILDHSLIYAVRKFKLPRSSPILLRKFVILNTFRLMNFAQIYFKHPEIWHFPLMTLTHAGFCGSHFSMKHLINMYHSVKNELDQIQYPAWITPANKQIMRNRDIHKKRAISWKSSYHWQIYQNLRIV